jgi:hypothetical protein
MKHKCKTWRPGIESRYVQLKRDGIWLELTRANLRYAATSKPSYVTAAVEKCLGRDVWAGMPDGTTVYGELYSPGKPASDVKSALADGRPLAFDAFAIGSNPDYTLEHVRDVVREWGFHFAPFFALNNKPLPSLFKADEPQTFYKFWKGFTDCEGVVYKDSNLEGWHKWKPVRTIDLVVAGFEDGNGKHLGLVGSMLGAVYMPDGNMHIIANVGTGMSDDLRMDVSLDREKYLGSVIEVEYQYVGSQGRLRHPRLKCFRDDKLGRECLLDQDPDLEAAWRN